MMKSASKASQLTTVSVPGKDSGASPTVHNVSLVVGPPELMVPYDSILSEPKLSWVEQHRTIKRLGSGGQGVVFLSERVGADGFTLPVGSRSFRLKVMPTQTLTTGRWAAWPRSLSGSRRSSKTT